MDGLPAVSCTFFNFVCVLLSSEDNLAVHTEHSCSKGDKQKKVVQLVPGITTMGRLSWQWHCWILGKFFNFVLSFASSMKHIFMQLSYLQQLSVTPVFIQILSSLIPKYDWGWLWEKPAWRAPSTQIKCTWSSSCRAIFVSNYFLAPRFDFRAENFFTESYFSSYRWCLDGTLDFFGWICERLCGVEIVPPELNLAIE